MGRTCEPRFNAIGCFIGFISSPSMKTPFTSRMQSPGLRPPSWPALIASPLIRVT